MFIKLLIIIFLLFLLFDNIEPFENNNKVYVTCLNDFIIKENDITSENNNISTDIHDNETCDTIKYKNVDYFPEQEILSCQDLNQISGHCNATNLLNYEGDDIEDIVDDPYHTYHDFNTNYKVLYDIDITNKILTEKGIEIRDNMNTSGVFSNSETEEINNTSGFFSINI